jgi:Lon protease-like protein
MAAFHPPRDALPAAIAVFPLSGALLLPRGKLPLSIFEPRYLAMIEDSLANRRLFAMVQPDPNAAPTAHGAGLYQVGCLGRLSSFSETDDGRFLVTLTGLARFAIAEELPGLRGYRMVRADYTAYPGDRDLSPDPSGVEREALLIALKAYFAGQKFDANWDAIRRMPDESLVVTLSMVCPFEPAEKQALLEAPTEADRAATLLALLQMGAAGSDLPPGRPAS